MLLISISGLFVIQYLFYPILLLDIIQRFPALGNVIKAVRANSRTLLYTLLLLMVILYLYSIFAFVFFSHDFLGVILYNFRTQVKDSKCTALI